MSSLSTLQVIGSARLGGAENFFLRLHEALNRADVPSVALTRKGSDLSEQVQGPGDTARMGNVLDPLSRWSVRQAIRRHRPDIVQTWMGRATRLVRLPAGQRPAHVARLGGFYDPSRYRHAHALVGNTRGICDFLVREGVPAAKVHHIGNFVARPGPVASGELADWRARLGLPAEALVVFALGRLHPNKGFDTLVSAFERLPESVDGRPLHLLIAGDGPLAAPLARQVDECRARERIHLLGWQRRTDALYALADLFVCPSRHEPLGNVILEAWSHRLPVVTTATDGALELVTPGDDGLLVPVDEPAAMATRIEAVLGMPKEDRQALAQSGASIVEREHGEQAVVDRYKALYAELVGRWA